ncbi:MAG: large repetitive protein, partial [Thermoplasmata archaeon]|nr:large repetitive protein [Thermoplasmata archaeon]
MTPRPTARPQALPLALCLLLTASLLALPVHAAPLAQQVVPAHGTSNGGVRVTIHGSGFLDGALVEACEGGACSRGGLLSFQSDALLAVLPAHAPGVVDLVITNPDGRQTRFSSAFTYDPAPAPAVTSVEPAQGPAVGGTAIHVKGSGFVPLTNPVVSIGGVPAIVTGVGNDEIDAVTVGHPVGTVDVVVTNPDGQSSPTATAARFAFTTSAKPTVSSLTPSEGSANGGTPVVVAGLNFAPGATLRFGSLPASSVVYAGVDRLVAVAPAGNGAVPVLVVNPDGTTSAATPFTFTFRATPAAQQVRVTGVAPARGPASGHLPVNVTGANFAVGSPDKPSVRFGGIDVPAADVTVVSATQLRVLAPAQAAGARGITVTNPAGTPTDTGVLPAAFTYVDPVRIDTLSPASGPSRGGTPVVLAGTGFDPAGVAVQFDGVPGLVTQATATSITVVAPPHAKGPVAVQAIGMNGLHAALLNGFTYDASPLPKLLSIAPTHGDDVGGTLATLTGTGFAAGADPDGAGPLQPLLPAVTIGGAKATVLRATATTIDLVVPP